jgi:hypothetical protein
MRALIDQHKTYVMRYPGGLNEFQANSGGHIVALLKRTQQQREGSPKGYIHLFTWC